MTDLSTIEHNKARIARQFSRAASTYDAAADVQLDIAFDAMSYVPSHYTNGLDIGCGTGRISKQLINRCDKLIAMDLAYGMLHFASQNMTKSDSEIHWLQADAEHLPVASGSVDMLFSSMALQWCSNQQNVMSEVQRVMARGAHGILAIMCEGSFSELNDSWQQIDNTRHVNEFASANSWQQAAKAQGLHVDVQIKQYVTWHKNIRQLLNSIKAIGANVLLPSQHCDKVTIAKNKALNRDTLQHLETVYQQKYAKNGQLPLTYRVCYLDCSKTL